MFNDVFPSCLGSAWLSLSMERKSIGTALLVVESHPYAAGAQTIAGDAF